MAKYQIDAYWRHDRVESRVAKSLAEAKRIATEIRQDWRKWAPKGQVKVGITKVTD